MIEVISVRFKDGGKEYYFDPRGTQVQPGDEVIIETAKGLEFGVCAQGNMEVEDQTVVQPLRPLVRLADDKDRLTLEHNREREKAAFEICRQKVEEHGLDMHLVNCECSFDCNKILFFFTSEGRVDFRSLVRDLASALHARIELRQIGVRDESRLLGGLGICGRPLCCSTFLEEFQPVSIKMAKTQGLSLNPAKISGACGRLMCCLKYEQDAYEDAVKRLPKSESFVETPDGPGVVCGLDYLHERISVRLEDGGDSRQDYSPDEIRVIRSGKGRRPEGYVAPPREELEKLRKTPLRETGSLSESVRIAMAQLEEPAVPVQPSPPEHKPRGEREQQRPVPPEEKSPRQQRSDQGQARPSSSGRSRRRRRGGGKPREGGAAPQEKK